MDRTKSAETSPVVSFNGRWESRGDKTCSRLPLGHDSRCHAPGGKFFIPSMIAGTSAVIG